MFVYFKTIFSLLNVNVDMGHSLGQTQRVVQYRSCESSAYNHSHV